LQVLPQAAQLLGSVDRSVQPPEQHAGCVPDVQVLPQLPQLLRLSKLTHPLPVQQAWFILQFAPPLQLWHSPPTHEPPLQVLPQPPQLLGSLLRSLQPPEQHAGDFPDVQILPPLLAQAPQFRASKFKLVHVPLQHVDPAVQTLPQVPQLLVSVLKLMLTVPEPQPHSPPEQS